MELNPSGSTLVYGTYLGGGDPDRGESIAVDSAGAAYVTGSTDRRLGSGLPHHAGRLRQLGGLLDRRLRDQGGPGWRFAGLQHAVGRDGERAGTGVAVDSAGSAHVTGVMYEEEPTTSRPRRTRWTPSANGGTEAFVTKVAPNGASLVYSSFLAWTEGRRGQGDCGGIVGSASPWRGARRRRDSRRLLVRSTPRTRG